MTDPLTPLPKMTTPVEQNVILFDGHCVFCTKGARKLERLARKGTVKMVDFQQPDALTRFPGITYDHCMREMILIDKKGKVFGGIEAAVRALRTRPVIGWLAQLYYVPGIRWVCDRIYARIARNRYRLMGKAIQAGECDGGTCKVHFNLHNAKTSANSAE